jgi:hypothetical protein
MEMICPNCKKQARPGARFCGFCGAILLPPPKIPSPDQAINLLPEIKKFKGLLLPVVILLIFCSAISLLIGFTIKDRAAPINSVGYSETTNPEINMATASLQPAQQETATPFPIIISQPSPQNLYPDPVTFIYTYYNYINNRDYASAWSHLSRNFIEQMGINVGHPYDFANDYSAYWNTVARMDILAAGSESLDAANAVLRVNLRWNMNNGVSTDYNHRFYLVIEPASNSWLINYVETWK